MICIVGNYTVIAVKANVFNEVYKEYFVLQVA